MVCLPEDITILLFLQGSEDRLVVLGEDAQ